MDRTEFIKELTTIYEDFTEKNMKTRAKAYCYVLDENIDYDMLYKFMLQEHNSFKYAPTPAFLYGLLPKIKKYKETQDEMNKLKELDEKYV